MLDAAFTKKVLLFHMQTAHAHTPHAKAFLFQVQKVKIGAAYSLSALTTAVATVLLLQ